MHGRTAALAGHADCMTGQRAFLREDYLSQVQRVSLTHACTQDPERMNQGATLQQKDMLGKLQISDMRDICRKDVDSECVEQKRKAGLQVQL